MTTAVTRPAPTLSPLLGPGLLLAITIVALESVAMSTVAPEIARDLRGLSLYGWVSSAFMLACLTGAVLTGLVADRRGLAGSAGLALGLLGAGLVLVGFAPGMEVLIAGRILEGLGVGGLNALPFAVIGRAYQGPAQARMLGAVAFAWMIPGLVGPWLAAQLAEVWTWRAVMWSLGALLAVAAPLCVLPLRSLPAGAGDRGGKRLLIYAVTLPVATGLLLEGLRRADLLSVPLVLLGVLGTAWAARPLFPPGILSLRPGLSAALGLRAAMAWAMMGTSPFLTLALQQLHGLNATQAGLILTVGGISWTLGANLQAWIERRYGEDTRRSRVAWAAVVLSGGVLLTLGGLTGPLPLWTVFAGWFIAGVGMGVGYNSNSLYALSTAPQGQGGALSGQLANVEVLAVAAAAGLGGALIAQVQPTAQALTLILLLNLGVSLVPWLAVRRLR